MTSKITFNMLVINMGAAIATCFPVANVYGAPTALATQPFTSSSSITAPPNLMFVLDDSGSMEYTYLPDWAGDPQNYLGASQINKHQFNNNAFNGVAYNPGTRYRPPVMFTSTGALDTTTYPSQNGQSVAGGGDTFATSGSPNWNAVKKDGYGKIYLPTVVENLQGKAFSYTTVAGEYCDSAQLRNCTASATPTGSYTFPAKLRWCTTSSLAIDTTSNANSVCQASRIDAATDITSYLNPRMPKPYQSTITVNASTTVTGITVSGQQILSASAAGASTNSVATAIAANINACTSTLVAPCATVGYSAVIDSSNSSKVIVFAPGVTTATPVIAGGSATPTAFSHGNVPGAVLLTVITPSVISYPYPGTAAKDVNRTDCAGTTCTYAEEMTNYANWYTYYQTRMQMMKTATSIAFSNVDEKFRVGLYTINGVAPKPASDMFFINPSTFDGPQKNLWYSTFFKATAYGGTPLRSALANVGRMYAGKVSSLNGLAVNDPVQFSCQQNFTILSTDGYWNDQQNDSSNTPRQINATIDIGQQDSTLSRPYYDGGTFTRTVTQTMRTDEVIGTYSFLVEQRTRQTKSATNRLTETVTTSKTSPFQQRVTQLQRSTTPLNQSTYKLISNTYPLNSATKYLQQSTYKISSTPRILQRYINNLTKTTTPLDQSVYKLTVGTKLVTQKINKVTVGTKLVTQKINKVTVGTKLVTQKINKVTVGTKLVTKKIFKVTSSTYPLQSSTYKLRASTRQLQIRKEVSSNGGDTWTDTGWVDAVSTCTTGAAVPGSIRNTTCRYAGAVDTGGLNTCSTIVGSGSSPYSVLQAVSCAYEGTPVVAAVGNCNVVASSGSSPYAPSVACGYSTTAAVATGQNGCTAKDQTGSSAMAGDKVVCAYDGTSTDTTNLATCTWVVPATAASSPKTSCVYQAETPQTGQNACAVVAAGSATTNGTVWNTAKSCAYDGTSTDTPNLATCTWVVPATAASSPKTSCVYQAETSQTGQNACAVVTAGSATTNGAVWNTAKTCAYDATPTTSAGVATCTWSVPAAPTTSKTTCAYNAAAASVQSGQSTCTAVAPGTVMTNGTVWSGPSVACAYQAAVLDATNLLTCTAGAPSGGPGYNAYYTCGYINGTTTSNLNSCAVVADSSGPVNYVGPANACAYMLTPTTAPVTNCTTVAASPTFAAPRVSCAYDAAFTNATVGTCTPQAQSGGPSYVGPNVVCSYGGTAATNNNAPTCSAHDDTGLLTAWSGSKVTCAYNATATVTNNVATCTTKAAEAGPNYSNGARVDCAYGAASAWTNVTSGSCNAAAQSGGSPYAGPATACAYNGPSINTNVGVCNTIVGDGVSVLQKVDCAPGPFTVVLSTVVSTVDSCSTAPTSSGAPEVISTATTCAYQTGAALVDAPTCTAHPADGASPYSAEITCSVPDTGFVPVEPSCTPAGSVSPDTFDAFGKIVECKTTNLTGTPAAFAPTASCAAGTDGGTKVQTNCNILMSTGPDPVETCATQNPGVYPDFVKTTCNTTAPTLPNQNSCLSATKSAPLWQDISCTYEAGSGPENTLADVAAYYYNTDLRDWSLGNCTGAAGAVLCTATESMNNVKPTPKDDKTTQHMVTFTLGLGASGYMNYMPTYETATSGDFSSVKGVSPYGAGNSIAASPTTGVCSWKASGAPCDWPKPEENKQTTIDDLWHAGVNGHGAYFSATSPDTLASSLVSALNNIDTARGATAAPGLSSTKLKPGDNYAFVSKYANLEWTGEIERLQIDPYSGSPLATPDWSAKGKLDAKLYTTRNIYVFDASVATTKLKAFTSANFATNTNFTAGNTKITNPAVGLTQFVCASTDICLTTADQTSALGTNLVNFLRGDRSNEGAETNNNKYYRTRENVLGDLVNAELTYVSKPLFNYSDPGYSTFVSDNTSRQAVLYAGANDGMLHAFAGKGTAATETLVEAAAAAVQNAARNPTNAPLAAAALTATTTANAAVAADTSIGQELWAFIPTQVMSNLYKLADKKYKDKHMYYVDGTPVVGDICVSNCSAATAVWKTILVGGLGRGGRGYYALDITDPANPKALWEFSDANLGYSFGNPQIAKLDNGNWVVLVSSGYNNIPNSDGAGGDGVGRLFVLDALTGTEVSARSPISTGVGSVATPSGLAKIVAQVRDPAADNTIEAVYGGDLLGNLWRFDINNAFGAAGYDAQLLANLQDGTGNPQPITTKPEVGLIQNQYVVFVGTGRYLDLSDASTVNTQSLYGIKDPRGLTPLPSPSVAIHDNPGGAPRVVGTSTAGFVRQIQTEVNCPTGTPATVCVAGDKVTTSTNNAVDFLSNNGWFVDLTRDSERANTDPALALGMLGFNVNQPSLNACDLGGKSYQYVLNYKTGGPLDSAQGNQIVGTFLADELTSRIQIVVTESGKVVTVSGLASGALKSKEPPQQSLLAPTRRTSWRELIRGN